MSRRCCRSSSGPVPGRSGMRCRCSTSSSPGSDDSGLRYDRAIALLGYTDDRLLDEVIEAFAADDGAASSTPSTTWWKRGTIRAGSRRTCSTGCAT